MVEYDNSSHWDYTKNQDRHDKHRRIMRQLHNYCKWKPSVTRKKLWEKIPLQFHSLSTQKCWVINSWAFLEKSIHSFTTWALYKQMNTACLCLRVSCSLISNSEIPWTIARQTPLSMELSRQEYWSGLLFPSPRDFPDPGIEPRSPALQENSLLTELQGKPTSGNKTLQS